LLKKFLGKKEKGHLELGLPKKCKVCEDKPGKSVRQVVEAVNSQIKVFNGVRRWRNITTLIAYLQGHAIGYSFFRKSWLFK
jgi:hypothetical protein